MNLRKNAGLFGLLGLVFSVFAFISFSALREDPFGVCNIHIGLAILFIILFVLFGGLGTIRRLFHDTDSGRGVFEWVYFLVFFVFIVMLNVLASQKDFFYIDSTRAKALSLAPQTMDLLDKIDGELEIRAFWLESTLPEKVKNLLRRIAAYSGKISFSIHDPKRSPLLMSKFNLEGSEVIHINYKSSKTNRGYIVPQRAEEQDVVNVLVRLLRTESLIAYMFFGHGEQHPNDDSTRGLSEFVKSMQAEGIEFRLLVLQNTQRIPDDADLILILGPKKDFSEHELNEIRAYLKLGGRALMLHNPRGSSAVRKLASKAGIEVGEDIVLEASSGVLEKAVQLIAANYGLHPITEGLSRFTAYNTASSVRPEKDASSVVPLVFSSPTSWAEKDLEGVFAGKSAISFDKKTELKGPLPIASAWRGNYQGGEKESRIVVFGDVDFITNANIMEFFNRDLILDSALWLVGIQEGPKIRARTLSGMAEPITSADFRLLIAVCLFVIPESILLVGLFVWWKRKEL